MTQEQKHRIQKVKGMIDDLVGHLRDDVSTLDDPRADALFETAAEVLLGLRTAFDHYERRSEEAWRGDDG